VGITCPKCHSENTDTARYCSNCATSLTSAKTAPPAVTKTLESPTRIVAPGTVFASRYEILESIGAGGMGEVYRALDKNLSRQVAIKILPAAFAEDKERMARFEREAKLLAVLNHPNIAAIHGLEESGGRRFLVLELAEGETLQARLNRGALPVEEALETCRQVAEGLEAAHEKGIVHRDLKPGNIVLTPEGKVKILDFGLAKVYGGETTSVDIEKSPTITAQMTEPGVILGTAAYMSPEQIRSRPVDKKTDVWSFGCVLYEFLTGTRAFHGETVSDTLAQILKGEPDWRRLPPETPGRIRILLRHCLEKDAGKRFRDIGDAAIEVSDALGEPSGVETAPARRQIRSWMWATLIGGPLLAIVLTTLVTSRFRPAAVSSIGRFMMKVEPGLGLEGIRVSARGHISRNALAISRDGRFIVYSASPKNAGSQTGSQIYLRRIDQLEATPIKGSEGGIAPFLSPDDRWVGFWDQSDRKLKRVSVDGGVPAVLCDTGDGIFGAEWESDNTIIFGFGTDSRLLRVSGDGGKPEVLTAPDAANGEYAHRLPHCLPGRTGLLFTIMGDGFDLSPRLALLDFKTRKWRVLMENAADGRYLPTGHLVFLRGGTLMAIGFDLARLEIRGQPMPTISNVMQSVNATDVYWNAAAGQLAISDSGCLAYVPGGMVPDRATSLVRVDMKGDVQPIMDSSGPFVTPRVSPDGQLIAYRTLGARQLLWIYDLNRGRASPLTREGRVGTMVWTPDGKGLAFAWSGSGQFNLYCQPADGSSPMKRLTTSENLQRPHSFTPDGAVLAFVEFNSQTLEDILLLDMKSGRITPFLNTKATEGWPAFSPNGHWLAYASDDTGQFEVWVRPFPGPGGIWKISTDYGCQPIWSRDGKQLFYRRPNQVWVADVRTDADFSASKPRLLFEKTGFLWGNPINNFDLWPDGQGFIMVRNEEGEPQSATDIIFVQNWFEELKRLVPAGKK
jgi:Tol biopolymer transport system component